MSRQTPSRTPSPHASARQSASMAPARASVTCCGDPTHTASAEGFRTYLTTRDWQTVENPAR